MKSFLVDTDLLLEFFQDGKCQKDVDQLFEIVASDQVQGCLYLVDQGVDKIWFNLSNQSDNLQELESFILWLKTKFVIIDYETLDLSEKSEEINNIWGLSHINEESKIELICAIAKDLEAIVTDKPDDFEGANFPIMSIQDLIESINLNTVVDLEFIDDANIIKYKLDNFFEITLTPQSLFIVSLLNKIILIYSELKNNSHRILIIGGFLIWANILPGTEAGILAKTTDGALIGVCYTRIRREVKLLSTAENKQQENESSENNREIQVTGIPLLKAALIGGFTIFISLALKTIQIPLPVPTTIFLSLSLFMGFSAFLGKLNWGTVLTTLLGGSIILISVDFQAIQIPSFISINITDITVLICLGLGFLCFFGRFQWGWLFLILSFLGLVTLDSISSSIVSIILTTGGGISLALLYFNRVEPIGKVIFDSLSFLQDIKSKK